MSTAPTTSADSWVVTQDDKTMAVLAHVLQLVGGFIAPLFIFLLKRQSRFISFHALQVLLLQGIHILVSGMLVTIWISMFFFGMWAHSQGSGTKPPTEFLVLFPLAMLISMAVWLAILILAVMYGIKAGRGEWAEYPILGKWARTILHIGPDGTLLNE